MEGYKIQFWGHSNTRSKVFISSITLESYYLISKLLLTWIKCFNLGVSSHSHHSKSFVIQNCSILLKAYSNLCASSCNIYSFETFTIFKRVLKVKYPSRLFEGEVSFKVVLGWGIPSWGSCTLVGYPMVGSALSL